MKNRKLQRRTLREVAQGRVRKGKAPRGEAAELEELQVDAQQQRVKSGDDARNEAWTIAKPAAGGSTGRDSTGNAQVHIFSRELSQALSAGIFLPSYHESLGRVRWPLLMLAKRDAYSRLLPAVAFHGSAGSIDVA